MLKLLKLIRCVIIVREILERRARLGSSTWALMLWQVLILSGLYRVEMLSEVGFPFCDGGVWLATCNLFVVWTLIPVIQKRA